MIDLFVRLFPAVAAALCLIGFAAITWRLQALSRAVASQPKKDPDPLPSLVAGLKWEMTSLANRLSSLESEAREAAVPAVVRSGMNLNKRTQALRQFRLGQASGDIAKSLDMPKTEVDLLLKVHRIVSRQ
jgi:hypothetical protein